MGKRGREGRIQRVLHREHLRLKTFRMLRDGWYLGDYVAEPHSDGQPCHWSGGEGAREPRENPADRENKAPGWPGVELTTFLL